MAQQLLRVRFPIDNLFVFLQLTLHRDLINFIFPVPLYRKLVCDRPGQDILKRVCLMFIPPSTKPLFCRLHVNTLLIKTWLAIRSENIRNLVLELSLMQSPRDKENTTYFHVAMPSLSKLCCNELFKKVHRSVLFVSYPFLLFTMKKQFIRIFWIHRFTLLQEVSNDTSKRWWSLNYKVFTYKVDHTGQICLPLWVPVPLKNVSLCLSLQLIQPTNLVIACSERWLIGLPLLHTLCRSVLTADTVVGFPWGLTQIFLLILQFTDNWTVASPASLTISSVTTF